MLDRLIAAGELRLPRLSPIDALPRFAVARAAPDRWRGMMLGLAIGDALGNTSEGQRPAQRRQRHGEVRHYRPNWYTDQEGVGLPSDDTQLAFWTLEQWLDDGRLDPQRLAACFAGRRIFGMGNSVRSFITAFRGGQPWYRAADRSAGNGALMRIAPVAIPHLGGDSDALWVDAMLCAAVTHNDAASISACTAFAGMLAELLAMTAAPPRDWWRQRYVELAGPLEDGAVYRPRGGEPRDFSGRLTEFVQVELRAAAAAGLSAIAACERWNSGAYLLETVPCALHLLACHAHDPEEAIVRAVNDTVDNDTIAAIVGAVVGALHGEAALPERWRHGLLGRTTDRDDGRICELLDAAERRLEGKERT